MLTPLLGRLAAGEDLTQQEMADAVGAIMAGQCTEGQIGLLLMGLRLKGETVDEVAGAAQAMRSRMTRIRTSRALLLDTCGTGGDMSGTFNISTAAAIVTAAAGVPVAKHGNRSATSRSGSGDVLQHLGVNIEAGLPTVEACLEELGLCFCFAPLWHPSMKHVAPVRKKLGVPTIFNILGPLANPAGAALQLIGVGRDEQRPLLAGALARLGTQRALVVHGTDGLDEISLSAPTNVTEVRGGELREHQWQAADFGLPRADRAALVVDGPQQSAAVIQAVLRGEKGPPRDIVAMNAAAALWIAGQAGSLAEAAARAAQALDTGAAASLLQRLAERSHRG
jgi:anthranilate phosphoribosyltransferase